jgi:hypothetical protein
MPQAELAAVAPRGELEARERVDRRGVGHGGADVAVHAL